MVKISDSFLQATIRASTVTTMSRGLWFMAIYDYNAMDFSVKGSLTGCESSYCVVNMKLLKIKKFISN
jgi:hypothetical protein